MNVRITIKEISNAIYNILIAYNSGNNNNNNILSISKVFGPCHAVDGLVTDQPGDLFHSSCQRECMCPRSGRLIVLSLLPNVVSVPAAGVGGAYRRAALRLKQVCARARKRVGTSALKTFFFFI